MDVQYRRSRRLTLILGDAAKHEQSVLAGEIIRIAHACGLPGATILRGVTGYGLNRSIYATYSLEPSDAQPIIIVIIADPESIDDFVTGIAPVLEHGLLAVDDVQEVVHIQKVVHTPAAEWSLTARAKTTEPGMTPA